MIGWILYKYGGRPVTSTARYLLQTRLDVSWSYGYSHVIWYSCPAMEDAPVPPVPRPAWLTDLITAVQQLCPPPTGTPRTRPAPDGEPT
jgi:hypothetical protein